MSPHPNADSLSLCNVLGWQVVFNHNDNNYKDGDLVVYVEVDSVLPDKPEFEFLKNKNFRIKPIKLRGEISNGLLLPLSVLPLEKNVMTDDGKGNSVETQTQWEIGDDVSEILGAVHYEKPIPAVLSGEIVGYRPSFIRKTDELNARSYPHMLDALKGEPYYITRKDDGSSGTFFLKDGTFGVCSRNLHLKEDEKNGFWKMARKYDIENHLRNLFANTHTAIQAEIVGPNINGGNLGIKDLELHAFSLIDLVSGTLFPLDMLKTICNIFSMPMVTVVEEGDSFNHTLKSLLELANGLKYPNGKPAEGIVVRPKNYIRYDVENVAWNALSFKILNENYKEKE